MIITGLNIRSFAGLADLELVFTAGLNVILGANEAGKSTSFSAIQKALLVPANLNKRDFQAEIEKFIPLGGDTAQVELRFEHGENPYMLKKGWGGTAMAELKLPDGSLITGDDAIGERLLSLLPARRGTIEIVLMTYQSGLENTLADLQQDSEAVHTLSDLLRKTVMETDGIHVEGFRQEVQGVYDDYFSRWNISTGSPEGGKGINNPWKKQVGRILEAYYAREEAAQKLEQARAYELELDRINTGISEAAAVVEQKEAFIQANRPVVADLRERSVLEAQKEALELSIKAMGEANAAWPVLVSDIRRIEEELPEIEGRRKQLEAEQERARKAEAGRKVVEKFGRVQKKRQAVADAEDELARTGRLTGEELQVISEAASEIDIARTGISAGKLSATLRAKSALRLKVAADMDPGEDRELAKDGELPIEAGGRIAIEHPDWSLEVTSGEIDFADLQARYEKAENELAALLEEHEVESLEEAIRINGIYEEAAARLERARESLEEELDGESYEDLAAAAKDIDNAGALRSEAEVVEDIANVRNDISRRGDARKAKQAMLDALGDEYGTTGELLLRLGQEVGQHADVEGRLAGLAALPEGFDDAADFIARFEAVERECTEAGKCKNELDLERAELPGFDESSEELEELHEDAVSRFEATLRKSEAIARIAARTRSILNASDGGLFEQLESDLERYVATITDGRYREVAMEDGLPQGFERADGEVVLYDLLSHGTRDALSLALRLSMASRFLSGTDGFLAMDDPLVNLDPERQQKAALILKEYAEDKQVLVFTCHPSHAELLGGNLVRMEGKDLSGAKAVSA